MQGKTAHSNCRRFCEENIAQRPKEKIQTQTNSRYGEKVKVQQRNQHYKNPNAQGKAGVWMPDVTQHQVQQAGNDKQWGQPHVRGHAQVLRSQNNNKQSGWDGHPIRQFPHFEDSEYQPNSSQNAEQEQDVHNVEHMPANAWHHRLCQPQQQRHPGHFRSGNDVLRIGVIHTRKQGHGRTELRMPNGIEVGFDAVPVRVHHLHGAKSCKHAPILPCNVCSGDQKGNDCTPVAVQVFLVHAR